MNFNGTSQSSENCNGTNPNNPNNYSGSGIQQGGKDIIVAYHEVGGLVRPGQLLLFSCRDMLDAHLICI